LVESLGYADNEQAPADEVFNAVRRIGRVVSVPVTMDAEAGYGLPMPELAARLADAGAVGCNIEDTDHSTGQLFSVDEQAARLAALRAADADLVINARIDLFLSAADQSAVLDEAIARAHSYLAAGADCVYPILIRSAEVYRVFLDAVRPAAVNASYLPGGPNLRELAELGVARISLGTGLWRQATARLKKSLETLASGTEPY
jgi:2-methylisocitrate lyase-like PEP mutase family enzyme